MTLYSRCNDKSKGLEYPYMYKNGMSFSQINSWSCGESWMKINTNCQLLFEGGGLSQDFSHNENMSCRVGTRDDTAADWHTAFAGPYDMLYGIAGLAGIDFRRRFELILTAAFFGRFTVFFYLFLPVFLAAFWSFFGCFFRRFLVVF